MTETQDSHVQDLLTEYSSGTACAAELLCDRHPADKVAFSVIDADLTAHDITYGELRRESAKVAAALADLGVEPGDAVAALMGKSVELTYVLMGIWRRGAVHVPLFTAFATPAIALRLEASRAKVVVVDDDQRAKLAPGEDLPDDPPWKLVTVGGVAGAGELDFAELVGGYTGEEPAGQAVAVGGDGPLIQLFTSGTTGTPKGVPIPVRALASFHGYMDYGLDVQPSDVFWNAADPGWAYGLYYAILGPLATGNRSLLLQAGFSASLTWKVMQTFGVTNFAAAPTVYRSLRVDPTPVPENINLRRASSAGEPLTPEVVSWSSEVLGVGVRDHYGQTEHGMMIVNGWADSVQSPVRPGSMGRPLPGWSTDVLLEDSDQSAPSGVAGRLAINVATSPMMWFAGYVDAPEKTAERFTKDGAWYITGDAGSKDDDGFYYFSARDDDVIIMAGYRIGPFDIESVLVMHEDVAESAVVGVPDDLRGEVVEAYVVLRSGRTGSDELATELQQLVKHKFAAHAYPRRVHFVDELPKTPSGKIQRFLLRRARITDQ